MKVCVEENNKSFIWIWLVLIAIACCENMVFVARLKQREAPNVMPTGRSPAIPIVVQWSAAKDRSLDYGNDQTEFGSVIQSGRPSHMMLEKNILLGGIECITSAHSGFLPLQPEGIKNSRSWTPIAGSSPVSWRQAPCLFNGSVIQTKLQPKTPYGDIMGCIDRPHLNERPPVSSLENKRKEEKFGSLLNRSLKSCVLGRLKNEHTGFSCSEQTSEHALLAFTLGVRQIICCCNKMGVTANTQAEYLDFKSFCELVATLKPILAWHMNCKSQSDSVELNDSKNQFSITEKAIQDACNLSSMLDASKANPIMEGWEISKVTVLLLDSKKENCFLRFGSVNVGETTPSNSHPQIPGAGNDFLVVHMVLSSIMRH
nr:B3 domain-containing protein Os07g0563300 isoform X1 [Ipomoea batatas]